MVPTVNSDYFLKQLYPVELCKGEVWCSVCKMLTSDTLQILTHSDLCNQTKTEVKA